MQVSSSPWKQIEVVRWTPRGRNSVRRMRRLDEHLRIRRRNESATRIS